MQFKNIEIKDFKSSSFKGTLKKLKPYGDPIWHFKLNLELEDQKLGFALN